MSQAPDPLAVEVKDALHEHEMVCERRHEGIKWKFRILYALVIASPFFPDVLEKALGVLR